ncbi:MAG: glycosyltransferase family 4 protein [Sedimentisphaerales bacterium]|nr:glycosyltransferase family 4 protein [Sedimentisphaerales bacterium]
MADPKLNIVFMMKHPYPHGMASTKIIQNIIDYLARFEDISMSVLSLRGGRIQYADNPAQGRYREVDYQTIGRGMPSGPGGLWTLFSYYRQGKQFITQQHQIDAKNLLFVYGYPGMDNLPMIRRARQLGYKVIFYITEDVDVQAYAPDMLARIQHASERFLARRICRYANAVLAISRHLLAKMESICQDRIPVRSHPISIRPVEYPHEPTPFHEPVRILYGGTFAEKDGVEILIEVFDRIAERHGKVELILTGKGSENRMKTILDRITRCRHRERIRYEGYIRSEEYYSFISNCDILCMIRTSSAFANTGFPFKLGEYLATGKPVIASRVSDVTEYLADRENAVLVEPDSVDALADAMDFLLSDPDRAGRIGLAGRKAAMESFSMDVVGEPLRRLLLSL